MTQTIDRKDFMPFEELPPLSDEQKKKLGAIANSLPAISTIGNPAIEISKDGYRSGILAASENQDSEAISAA